MADFKTALRTILQYEGGWSDNPKDRGGATMKGVTLATYRQFYGYGKTKEDLRRITDEELEHIYRVGYWDVIKGDYFANQSLATYILDWVVNAGTGKIRTIQECCGLLPDGKIGPKSLHVFNTKAEWCFERIRERRIQFYNKIVENNPSQKVFLRSWLARANGISFAD